jgi:hypothetical protein
MLQFEPAPAGVCRVPCSCGTRPENGVLWLTWLCSFTVVEDHQDITATTPASTISTIRSLAKPPRRVRSYSSSGAALRSSGQGHVLAAYHTRPSLNLADRNAARTCPRILRVARTLNIVALPPHMARESHARRQPGPRRRGPAGAARKQPSLVRISHTTECIGVANQRKPLCRNN